MDTGTGRERAVSPPTDRVVDVMEMLAVEPGRRFTLAQICRAQGITRATGHAILATLVDRAWVDRDDVETTYGLGARMGAVFTHRRPPGRVLDDLLRALARDLDMPVSLATLRNRFLVITDTVAPPSAPQRVQTGLALPVIAPFGREYVAWADDDVRREWLRMLPCDEALAARIETVLGSIRSRGFTVDRLSRPLVRVHAALQALGDDIVVDELSASLANTYAALATIDVSDAELDAGDEVSVATVSVPIATTRSAASEVTMSLAAQPFARMAPAEIRAVAQALTSAADRAAELLTADGG